MLDTLSSLFSGLTFRWADVIDILLVGYILYLVIIFIRETRAVQLVKGLLLLVVVTYLSELFHLHTLNYILKGVLTLGAVALIIVFQPELRRALERIGRGKLFGGKGREDNSAIESSLGAIVRSAQ